MRDPVDYNIESTKRDEEERTRLAYLAPPDSEAEADTWDDAEAWDERLD